jgi:predicted transcriptional regulator
MPQVAIYLDDSTARKVDRVARRERLSRSAWVRRAVEAQLAGRLPESFFEVLGQWEDTRTPEQIVSDLRSGLTEQDRDPLA